MIVKCSNAVGNYDGREVPYAELLISGDEHTLSVRKYPRNVSIVMWNNADKSGTRISMKMPHNKFDFFVHVQDIINNFETDISYADFEVIISKWDKLVAQKSF